MAEPHRPALLGVVLTGGAGRRFGGGKPEALVAGVPMALRAARALEPWVHKAGLVGRALGGPGAEAGALPVREDLHPGRGPLAGLETALEWAREEGLDGALVLACDLPLVDAGTLGALVEAWGTEDAVVSVRGSRPEPLCAGYRVGALPAVRAALAGEDRSLHGLLARLVVKRVPVSVLVRAAATADPLLNVNTPGDRERAAALLQKETEPEGNPEAE